MPNLTLPLMSIEGSIEAPIAFTIARDVKKVLCVQDDTQLIVYNSLGVAKTDMVHENLKLSNEKNLGNFDSSRRLEVRITEDFDENSLGTGYTTNLDTFPIFRDPEIGVSVTPMYLVKNFEFEFTFTSPSKVEINNLRALLRTDLTRTLNIINHSVEYTMILPIEVDEFIEDVHELKNRLYPIDLGVYFREMCTNRIHLITDMVNTEGNQRFGVKEIQKSIFGTFEMTNGPDKADNKNDTNSHSLTFSYTFSMEVPSRVCMTFPVMICNKTMKYKYLKIISDNNKARYDFYTNKHLNIGRSASIMQEKFSGQSMLEQSTIMTYPINLPDFDDFYESKTRNRGYVTVMTVLCEVDETDRRSLLNLRDDLDPWHMPEKILNYIKGKGRRKVFVPNVAFIYIGLEQKGRHLSNMILTMDDDFNIKSSKDLDLMQPVRISIKVSVDPTFLVLEGQKDIEEDDELLEIVLEEYIELKDKFDTNDELEEGRILYILHLLIKKFHRYVLLGDCEQMKRFARILRKDSILAYRMGLMLVGGFPKLTASIKRCGIFVNGSGEIDILDTDPIIKEQQEKGEDKFRDEIVGKDATYDEQYRYRGVLDPFKSRNVMESYVVALRRN